MRERSQRERGSNVEESEGAIAKRARELYVEESEERSLRERGAIKREKMRRRCSLSNMPFGSGVSN